MLRYANELLATAILGYNPLSSDNKERKETFLTQDVYMCTNIPL